MNNSTTTKDPITIEKRITKRKWVPSIVDWTKDLLRVKFDSTQNDLEKITRSRFNQIFKNKNLSFLYDTSENSRFYKFVS